MLKLPLFILPIFCFLGYNRVNGEEVYQSNRIIVLILEEINEATVKQPITALLTGNTIDMVGKIYQMIGILNTIYILV